MGNGGAQIESDKSVPHHPLPITHCPFRPAWWCRGAHMQTLWPYLMRPRPRVSLQRERLELPDGDFLDLDWLATDSRGPIVLILHGLEGSSNSKYALGLLQAARVRGWRGVVLHFRGCSGEPNRLTRSYHSGETSDLAHVVALLKQRDPQAPLFVVGYSLGGNVLLKWLGETGARTPIHAAVAVSVPFLLGAAADRLEVGFSRLYQWELMQRMRRSVRKKSQTVALPLDLAQVARLRTFREFDEHVTARLHGFAGAEDYYAQSSSRQFLHRIATPTLIVHSKDDPFMTSGTVPTRAELSAAIEFELCDTGGHVGFVADSLPWRPRFWLEEKIPAFLGRHLAT
jgi:hypothetical protein